MSKAKAASTEEKLLHAVNRLEQAVRKLPEGNSVMFNPKKNLLFAFVKGVFYGLGILTAVAIVIPLIASLLQQVEWIPLVGDFFVKVIERIQEAQILK